MIRKFAFLIAPLLLAGCAQTYLLDGKKYESKEAFLYASQNVMTDAVRQITPLPQPLSAKKLVFAMPSERAMYEAGIAHAAKIDGKQPTGPNVEIFRNLTTHNYNGIKVYADALQKRRVYSSVDFRDMNSLIVSLEPSADTDVLYLTSPVFGSPQFFFASQKSGKQIFAYDRSGGNASTHIQAFVDAVQALAIRE